MADIIIRDIDESNTSEYGPRCFLKQDNEGYLEKVNWLSKRFSEGLTIRQLYFDDDPKCIGFIEYVPGEYAWRAVDAEGWMFIHCIWITPNKNKEKGYGSLLVDECVKDAKKESRLGVAVVTSNGSFMAGRDLFVKNGFESTAVAKPSFDLMVKPLKKGPSPRFRDWEKQLAKYDGFNIIYSKQCPWVARSVEGQCAIAEASGFQVKVEELKTAKQAQNAPSVYSAFNVVNNGKLLVDHYVSDRRFQTIVGKVTT